ncbi:MAG: DUF2059 domain-containing protein [Terricaulis sp.]
MRIGAIWGAVWAVLALLTAPLALAQAEAPDHEARLVLARQIIALRSEESEMTLFQAKLPYFLASIAAATHLTDAERTALPGLVEHAYRAAMAPAREQSAVVYANTFTADQLQQVLNFYQSDAGKAFLAHQQELTTASISLQRLVDAAVISSVVHGLDDQRRAAPQ